MKKTMRIVFALLLVAAMLAFPVGAVAEPTHSGEAGALSGLSATSTETISSGTYYIQNRKYKRFAQIDNDDANKDYKTESAIIEQFPIDGGTYQQWAISSVNGGYVKIVSKQSGLALTVKSGDEHSKMGTIVQKSYSGSKNQQWKITKTSHGSYKIKARSSEDYSTDDLVLCVNTQGLHSVDGLDLKQRVFVDNISYMDEWIMLSVGNQISFLQYMSSSDPHYDTDWMNDALNAIGIKGSYNGVNCIQSGNISYTQFSNALAQSKLFSEYSHGDYNQSGAYLKIGTMDYHCTNIYNFNSNVIVKNLSNITIATFVACKTGYGGTSSNARNFVTASIKAGAAYAIGFADPIACCDASNWLAAFYEYYSSGYTVEAAKRLAVEKTNTVDSGIDSCVLGSKYN